MAEKVGDSVTTHTPRLVVLGASNVARGVRTIVKVAREELASPTDFFFSYAHGRSYGYRSNIGWWSYPSIIDSDLWSTLPSNRRENSFALITDVGNDILYGAAPEEIANWVRIVIARLQRSCSRIALTELPIESVKKLGSNQFFLMKAILFPKCRLNLKEVLSRAKRLNSLLKCVAEETEIELIQPCESWYGVDPIHIRRTDMPHAWRRYIRTLIGETNCEKDAINPIKQQLFWGIAPASWRSFKRERLANQPANRIADGSKLYRF